MRYLPRCSLSLSRARSLSRSLSLFASLPLCRTEIDAAVGKVVGAVDSSGQGDHTVIFFSSDNGAHQEGGHQCPPYSITLCILPLIPQSFVTESSAAAQVSVL